MADQTTFYDTRIVLTGGGSGGHVAPLVAVARQISMKFPGVQMRYIGGNGFTSEIFQAERIPISVIASGKFRRYFSILNFTDVFKIIWGILQALWHMYWYMPDVVFSKGGHGAVPALVAARFYRIPVVIHDSDSVPGSVNRWSGKFAVRIGVAFEHATSYFPAKKTAVVGNPVRTQLFSNLESPEAAKKIMGLDPKQPLLTILGGSQGSERINDFIIDLLPVLIKKFQIIHQVGNRNVESVKQESALILSGLGKEYAAKYKVFGFLGEGQYRNALNGADVVVSRAGSAIFEIAMFGRPSALIPLPESANDHQRINALEYFKSGACIYFEEANLLPNLFVEQISELAFDEKKRSRLVAACGKFAKPNAAQLLADEIVRIGQAA